MGLVDQSIESVRKAAKRFGKKPLAVRQGLSDAILRNVQDANWDPRSGTLRKLEIAAAELEAIHGPERPDAHRESSVKIPKGSL